MRRGAAFRYGNLLRETMPDPVGPRPPRTPLVTRPSLSAEVAAAGVPSGGPGVFYAGIALVAVLYATRELLVAYGRAGGTVVWLDVDLPSAAKRAGLSRDRPILGINPRQMLRHMLETRAPLYGEVATLTVQTGGRPPEDVTAEILAALPTARTGR